MTRATVGRITGRRVHRSGSSPHATGTVTCPFVCHAAIRACAMLATKFGWSKEMKKPNHDTKVDKLLLIERVPLGGAGSKSDLKPEMDHAASRGSGRLDQPTEPRRQAWRPWHWIYPPRPARPPRLDKSIWFSQAGCGVVSVGLVDGACTFILSAAIARADEPVKRYARSDVHAMSEEAFLCR
jgi:hypothetical protein